ncbi:MAG: tetratricopeptide repeat protein, partial [Salibacteraceae bacterium]
QNPEVLNTRAWVYYNVGEPKAALRDLNQALQMAPNFGQALYRRSRVRKDLGELRGASLDAQAAAQNGYVLPQGYLEQLR